MQFTEFSMKKKLMLSWHFGGKPHISQNPQKYAILIFFYEKKSMLSSNNTEGKFITSNNTQKQSNPSNYHLISMILINSSKIKKIKTKIAMFISAKNFI